MLEHCVITVHIFLVVLLYMERVEKVFHLLCNPACTERLNKINYHVSAYLRFCSLRSTLLRRKNKTNTNKNFLIAKVKKCVTQAND